MIYINNETDEAIRNWLQLNDQQYKFYCNNRKPILDKIRSDYINAKSSQNLREKIENLSEKAKSIKGKKNAEEILQYNVAVKYMDGDQEPREVKEIAEMAGVTSGLIRQHKDAAYREIRNHVSSPHDQLIYTEFVEEQQILQKQGNGKWLN
jgi:hypothetical protein